VILIAAENTAAESLLPPAQPDNSRIGANYTDAYLKPLNTDLPDGRKLSCRRKGLKITLTVGDRTGEGLMRRIEHGPDPRAILRQALEDAAAGAGETIVIENGAVYFA
jgi:hypothetical protein